jgi:Zn-dependent peptidase ImmA (M78 family)
MAKSNSNLPYGYKAEAEKIAEQLRAQMGLSKFSPLDAFNLAEHLDIPICPINQLLDPAEVEKMKATTNGKIKFSALWMLNCDGDKIILHNPFHSPCRQQSDMMHELAHIVRKHEVNDEIKKLSALFKMRPLDPIHEAEAVYLGGCLQIPRPGLMWRLKENDTYQQIADYYGACLEMVHYRVKVTGVEKQRAAIARKTF